MSFFNLKRCFELATTTPKHWIFSEIVSIHRIMQNFKLAIFSVIQSCIYMNLSYSYQNAYIHLF